MNVPELSSSGSELSSSDQGAPGTVDILSDDPGSPYGLADKKASQITEAENQKIDELTARFTKGFDPGAFGGFIMAYIPKLAEGLFPGSYAHLLILLFETFDVIQNIQLGLEALMGSHHQVSPTHKPSETNFTDEVFIAAEIAMLRKLLEPIREGTRNSIFWVGTRRVHTSNISEQLEAAIRVVETFKDDLCAALKPDHESRTIYSSLPVSVERTAMYSMKQLRLDTCRATLQWDNFNGSELELTSFFCFYKEHIMKTEPAKARASGWLPPQTPGTPRLSAEEASEGDLASWASHGVQNKLVDFLLKIALWLSLARGLPAVHLFCDVARLFVMDQPSRPTTNEYRQFLLHLVRIRAATGGALLSPSPVVPDSKNFPTSNVDYFQDIWRTGHQLSQGLFDETSLYTKHNVLNFKLAKAPARRRSGYGDMQVATQAAVGETLADIPSTPDEERVDEESSDDFGFALSPPGQSPMFRTRTV